MIIFATIGQRSGGGDKDTLRNVLQTNEFVVNLSNWKLRDEMNISSAEFGP